MNRVRQESNLTWYEVRGPITTAIRTYPKSLRAVVKPVLEKS